MHADFFKKDLSTAGSKLQWKGIETVFGVQEIRTRIRIENKKQRDQVHSYYIILIFSHQTSVFVNFDVCDHFQFIRAQC